MTLNEENNIKTETAYATDMPTSKENILRWIMLLNDDYYYKMNSFISYHIFILLTSLIYKGFTVSSVVTLTERKQSSDIFLQRQYSYNWRQKVCSCNDLKKKCTDM